jgi:hypothetical protein
MRNGVRQRIGYLGSLRVAEAARHSPRLLRDGYELLREQVQSRADGFFTSIAADNARARRVLELGGRLGLPVYRKLCDLVTLIAPVRKLITAPVEPEPADELVELLARDTRRFQLSLAWDPALLQSLERHGVRQQDFAVVRRAGKLVACAAVWDQRAFRQTVVVGYEGALEVLRPVVNATLVVRGLPPLPASGSVLDQGVILGAAAPDQRDWRPLWNELQAMASARGLSWLTIARDATDPELAVLRRLTRGREYRTTLYEVAWSAADRWPPLDAGQLCRPEVGLL